MAQLLSTLGHITRMEIFDIYVHDGKLLRVIEDTQKETVTMEVLLPAVQEAMIWFHAF